MFKNIWIKISSLEKCDYIWNLLLFILGIFFTLVYIAILIYKFALKDNINSIIKCCEECIKKIKTTRRKDEGNIENASKDVNIINIKSKNTNEKENPIIRYDIDKKSDTEKELVVKKPKNLCVICLERHSSIILSPCGHRCICKECYEEKKALLKICPMCRRNVDSVVKKIFDN